MIRCPRMHYWTLKKKTGFFLHWFNSPFSFHTHAYSEAGCGIISNSLLYTCMCVNGYKNISVLFICPRALLVNHCCTKFDTIGVSCIYQSLLNNCCRSGYFMVDSQTEIVTHEHILQFSTCSNVVTCVKLLVYGSAEIHQVNWSTDIIRRSCTLPLQALTQFVQWRH